MFRIPTSPNVNSALDYSAKIIDSIFGTDWENLLDANSIGGSVAQNMVFPILGAFNTIALFVVAIFLIILFTQGIIGTAHEGKAMGKRFHNVWIPLRGVYAIVFLSPIIGGMSLFQIAILACIGWSINFGNYIWIIGLNTFCKHGGTLTTSAPQRTQKKSIMLAKNMLLAQTYQKYFEEWQDSPLMRNDGTLTQDTFNDTRKQWELRYKRPENFTFPISAFGTIKIKCPKGENDSLCNERYENIQRLMGNVQNIATSLADPSDSARGGTLIRAINNYDENTVTAMRKRFATLPDMIVEFKSFEYQARQGGWLSAAAYYWKISSINQKRRNLITAETTMQAPATSEIKKQAYMDIDIVRGKYDDFINTEFMGHTTRTNYEDGTDSGIFQAFRELVGWLFAENVYKWFVNNLATDDPVVTLTDYGHLIITGTQTMFVSTMALASAAIFSKTASESWIGSFISNILTGGTAGAAAASLNEVMLSIIVPTIILLSVMLYIYGFTLAYYLPAIPMILFLSAAINWVILVMEAIVAAPLWLASHAMSEGEGPIGHNAKQGYFLLLSILIRPALIVTGFFFSMIIILAFGQIINLSFTTLGLTIADKYVFGPFSTFALTFILATTLLTYCKKIFSLIPRLPSEVTKWIGQYFHNLGEDQDESRIEGGFKHMGQKSEKMIESSAGPVGKILNKAKNQKRGKGNTESKNLEKDLQH